MKDSLTKNQLVWVIIRTFGVIFCYRALLLVVTLIQAGNLFSQTNSSLFSDGSGGSFSLFGSMAFHIILSGVMGIYLLFFGEVIHRLIMSEPFGGQALPPRSAPVKSKAQRSEPGAPWPPGAARSREKSDPRTTLTGPEEKEFKIWLEKNEALQSRAEPDQIALFRDFQKSQSSSQ